MANDRARDFIDYYNGTPRQPPPRWNKSEALEARVRETRKGNASLYALYALLTIVFSY